MAEKNKVIGYGAELFMRRSEDLIEFKSDRKLPDNSLPPYKFAYSRTALKFGLIAAGVVYGDSILVPGFICESALEPFEELNIKPIFYPVNEKLEPVWSKLKGLLRSNTKAFMIVHYFGQPQSLDDCLTFCEENSVLLIEDNAHGYGSMIHGKLLGTFGAIGFCSPRKSFPIKNGAYLYLSDNLKINPELLTLMPGREISKKDVLKKLPVLKTILKHRVNIRKYMNRKNSSTSYGSQELFRDAPINNNYGMDYSYDILIQHQDLELIKHQRRSIYNLWLNWAVNAGLQPVFHELNEGAVPLVFPAFTESAAESIKWFERGHRMGVDIHSWPTLPIEIVEKNGEEMRLWERLLCFPIHQNMNPDSLKKRIHLL